ncbi:ATP-binding protein [Streptomyces sp. NBC_01451]|uniref:ATP-binding protein n=1 Tax=Streptomyces sp. NBC_01451 TaxID=2903872 RepID=UPI002E342396|nr:LuxR C-terminal-related transcriptional regulator [Streptomyces sp. NBC_01451]
MASSRAGNLPATFTSFVGRQPEIARIGSLLQTVRLLTLAGPGGVGKTRLALEAAGGAVKAFSDGVWLVELAPVREPAAVAGAVATALGVPDRGARPAVERLAGFLAQRRALIVLDNCEHLAHACAELTKALLSAAPELHVLATSRHALDIMGEHVLTVPPLSPQEAVSLLQDRAIAVRPGFQVSEVNRERVSRLCADLDGLPLAIELAASRLRALTVDQLADRLGDRFALLTSQCPTALPHQRTLRGTIDWSYELCTPAERLLWNRLCVFAGSFALDAVEGVCAGDGIAEGEVLDLLDRLVVQSVVLTTETEGLPRYRLLETIRQYGRERLMESGEVETVLLRHRDFFRALAQRGYDDWYGPDQVRELARLRADHPDLLAALDHDGDPRARLVLVTALTFHWCVGGFLTEGRRQIDRALVAAPEPTPERGRALWVAAWVGLIQGDLAAADRRLDEAEALGEQLGDLALGAHVSGFRGMAAHCRGQTEKSISWYEEALAAVTALGDERETTSWLLSLAAAQAYAGDPRAAETGRQVISAFEASGERWGRSQVLMALGHDAWARGDREAAKALVRSALENMRGFNDYAMVAWMIELLAWATASGRDHGRAARLLGVSRALCRVVGTSISAFGPQVAEWHRCCEGAVVDALGLAGYAQALAEGGLYDSPGRAIDYALIPAAERPSPATPADALTRRERQVAALVAEGLSNRQISSALGMSPRTADRHVQNILGKLGFGSRARIASWWSASQVPGDLTELKGLKGLTGL